MLVITRKKEQSIMIGSGDHGQQLIRVMVGEVQGGMVKLCFEAGRDVPIHRAEVWHHLQQERQHAPATPASSPHQSNGKSVRKRRPKSPVERPIQSDIEKVIDTLAPPAT